MSDKPPTLSGPCRWPECLTEEQQQVLCENVGRSMLGEETGPDPEPTCDCPERRPFDAHADEALALAAEA